MLTDARRTVSKKIHASQNETERHGAQGATARKAINQLAPIELSNAPLRGIESTALMSWFLLPHAP
jgi:hypothetical protein